MIVESCSIHDPDHAHIAAESFQGGQCFWKEPSHRGYGPIYLTAKEWDMINDGALGWKVKLRKLAEGARARAM